MLFYSRWGQFFTGDSYIVLHKYEQNRREHNTIYFWQGNKSTADEKGASALLVRDMDDELKGKAVQVRVTQGKEPAHFRDLFLGKFIVFSGGRHAGFKNSEETDSYDTDGVGLFQVQGTTASNTYAVQVPEVASSLNSGDCFILINPTHVYIWNGSGSNDSEKEYCREIANVLANDYQGTGDREIVTLNEGEESEEFWQIIGGKGDYPQFGNGDSFNYSYEPRLFQASNATGAFRVEEISNYCQDDLTDDDIFILDTYNQIFVWTGKQSNQTENDRAVEFVYQYIAKSTERKPHEVVVIKVFSGHEPSMFTCHFRGWDNTLSESDNFSDPYAQKLSLINATHKEPALPPVILHHVEESEVTHHEHVEPTLNEEVHLHHVEESEVVHHEHTEPEAPKAELHHIGETKTVFKQPTEVKSSAAPAPTSTSTDKKNFKFSVPVAPAVLSANMNRAATTEANNSQSYLNPADNSFSFEELKAKFPAGVDPSKKEEYLSNSEFVTLFGVDKATFAGQPKWKRDAKKKELGLF